MSNTIKFIIAVIAAASIGFFAAKKLGGTDLIYDYKDCIKIKCDPLPQKNDLNQVLKECIAAVPLPNYTLCQHVPPQNQQACFENEIKKYVTAIQPCYDAYEEGLNRLMKCKEGCEYLLVKDTKKAD